MFYVHCIYLLGILTCCAYFYEEEIRTSKILTCCAYFYEEKIPTSKILTCSAYFYEEEMTQWKAYWNAAEGLKGAGLDTELILQALVAEPTVWKHIMAGGDLPRRPAQRNTTERSSPQPNAASQLCKLDRIAASGPQSEWPHR
jgi:hypothetical protein